MDFPSSNNCFCIKIAFTNLFTYFKYALDWASFFRKVRGSGAIIPRLRAPGAGLRVLFLLSVGAHLKTGSGERVSAVTGRPITHARRRLDQSPSRTGIQPNTSDLRSMVWISPPNRSHHWPTICNLRFGFNISKACPTPFDLRWAAQIGSARAYAISNQSRHERNERLTVIIPNLAEGSGGALATTAERPPAAIS
jgi:hypothetical protein